MLKINNPQSIPFDPETDVGYALSDDKRIWYFGENHIVEFSVGYPIPYYASAKQADAIFGPFTRFMGTATTGNDL